LKEIKNFVKSFIVIYKKNKNKNRLYKRIAITPYKKWYLKGRNRRIPLPDMEDDNDNFEET